MEKIKIITDSTSDLPIGLIEKYDIEVLPLTVNFGNESYRDGVDITLKEFFDKMNKSEIFPTTSQINPQAFFDCYKRYLDNGYKIISIHLSSRMSGTYQSACIARDMLETEDIVVIDSENVTSGLGILVVKACNLRDSNLSLLEIKEKIIETIPHIKSALAFESLDNLVKGGRLSKTAGVIGNILGIRLILGVVNGEMEVLDKVRGSKKAVKTILEYAKEHGIKENDPCMLLQADNKEIFEALKESLESQEVDYYEAEVGCVVGTHSGTGACGLFFIENY